MKYYKFEFTAITYFKMLYMCECMCNIFHISAYNFSHTFQTHSAVLDSTEGNAEICHPNFY